VEKEANTDSPISVEVPDTLKSVDSREDTKRFLTPVVGYAQFNYDVRLGVQALWKRQLIRHEVYKCHTIVKH